MRMCGVVVACLLAGSVARAGDIGRQVDALVDDGEAWDVDVPKLVAALGTPALVKPDRIEWAQMDNDLCAHVVVTADTEGFLKSFETTEIRKDEPDGAPCRKLLGKKAKVPAKLRGPKPLSADAEATTALTQWSADKFAEIFDSADNELREKMGSPYILAQFKRVFEGRAGKFVKVGTPFGHAFKGFRWVVSAPLVYEKGTIQMSLSFATDNGKPVLTSIGLELPDELVVKFGPKDAVAPARADLDLLLAAKTATFYDHMFWETAKKVPRSTFEPKLAEVLAKIGKIKSVKQTAQTTCDDEHECFTYEITSANGTSKATLELGFVISEWLVYSINLDPP